MSKNFAPSKIVSAKIKHPQANIITSDIGESIERRQPTRPPLVTVKRYFTACKIEH
ncbi:hypothetical protein D3C85_1591770 [compost metagenome]